MLLVGVLGTPFFWAGVEPAVIHNGLLLGAHRLVDALRVRAWHAG